MSRKKLISDLKKVVAKKRYFKIVSVLAKKYTAPLAMCDAEGLSRSVVEAMYSSNRSSVLVQEATTEEFEVYRSAAGAMQIY